MSKRKRRVSGELVPLKPIPAGFKQVRTPHWLAPLARSMDTGRMVKVEDERPREQMLIIDTMPDGVEPWYGMVVGHWVVGHATAIHPARIPAPVYVCISKCGIVTKFSYETLATGLTPTCSGCDPANNPAPACRVLPNSEMGDLLKFWENSVATVFEEKNDLKNRELVVQWETLARPVVTAIVAATRYGKTYGWKAWIKTAHRKPSVRDKTVVTVGEIGKVSMLLNVTAAGSQYEYLVELGTGRTNYPWPEVAEAIRQATSAYSPVPVVHANGAATAATPAPGAVDLAKLSALRQNLDTLLSVGQDINEVADLKAAAKARLDQARAAERDANVKVIEAEEVEKVASDHQRICQEKVNDYDMRLRNAVADRDKADERLGAARARTATQAAEYSAANGAFQKAVAELKELEALEADQLKKVGDARGMQALLAALSQISG